MEMINVLSIRRVSTEDRAEIEDPMIQFIAHLLGAEYRLPRRCRQRPSKRRGRGRWKSCTAHGFSMSCATFERLPLFGFDQAARVQSPVPYQLGEGAAH